ncbi:hypothetical protein ACI2IY_12080 [Lysobacter enzymogenes]|uniref:hypothetical protein n=1 Tax=Lysobacter enzymogenes TaxID=69 RepID=UPI00384E69EA
MDSLLARRVERNLVERDRFVTAAVGAARDGDAPFELPQGFLRIAADARHDEMIAVFVGGVVNEPSKIQ